MKECLNDNLISPKKQSISAGRKGGKHGPIPPNKVCFTTTLQHVFDQLIHALSSSISASYDQLSCSVYVNTLHPDEVLDIFEQHFGKSKLTDDGHWNLFNNGMKLSKCNKFFYHFIRFSDLDVLADLEHLQRIFPKRHVPGKLLPSPAILFSKVEIKFDYPLPGLGYDDVEIVQQALSHVLFLRNKYAELKVHHGRRFKKRGENTHNGKLGFSFGQLREIPHKHNSKKGKGYKTPDSRWQINPKSHFFGKLYPKSFDHKESWCIRLEATLKGNALAKVGGNRLPDTLLALQNRLVKLRFDDFWKLEAFDNQSFFKEVSLVYWARPIKGRFPSMTPTILLSLMRQEDNQDHQPLEGGPVHSFWPLALRPAPA